MKYQSTITKKVYELTDLKKRTTCPECSHNRRKSNDKCLHWDLATNRGYCHHCNTSFFEYEHKPEKEYKVPEYKNITDLTDKAVKWFESRAISQKTLKEMKIYSDTEWMPQHEKEVEVICFPYFKDKKLVNIKYRGANKAFKLVKDAELTFWNIDNIKSDFVIVEGEIDLLSFYEAGFDGVMSVPNGANNLEFLDDIINKFNGADRIWIAVDNDKKGIELRDELARRFGFERCLIVNFKECKDANEYLLKYGALELSKCLEEAQPFPIKGIVKVDNIYSDIVDLFNNGVTAGKTIDHLEVDEFITWELGRLAIVTGIPGHGKSEMVDYIVSKLNLLYGWKAAYFTPENYPLKFHYAKMYEKYIGKSFDAKYSNEDEFYIAYQWMRDNYFYIMDEEDNSVETVISSAKSLVKNRGVKILVVDPYNKLDHQYTKSETQYISKFLDELIMFGKYNNVLVILVAHPKKMNKDGSGLYEVPNLYDISGSAHFFNKTDYGLTIYRHFRDGGYTNSIELHIQKVKFKHLGKTGMIPLTYNFKNGRFENQYKNIDEFDNSNWLIK